MNHNHPVWIRLITPTERPGTPPPVARGGDTGTSRPSLFVAHTAMWFVHRPWLALVATAAVAIWVAGRVALVGWRHRRHADHAQLITIAPPPEVDPAGARALWANLSGTLSPSWRRRFIYGTPHVVWEYQWIGRQFTIRLWVPGTVPVAAVEAAIRGAWPGAATSQQPVASSIPADAPVVAGGQLLPAYAEWFPFATDHDADPLRAVVAAGTGLRDHERACVQILARPAHPRRVRRARQVAMRLRDGHTATPRLDAGAPLRWLADALLTHNSRAAGARPVRRSPTVERDIRAIVEKTAHPLWETGIRYIAVNSRPGARSPARVRATADALASAFAVYTGRNRLTHRTRLRHPATVTAARRLGSGVSDLDPGTRRAGRPTAGSVGAGSGAGAGQGRRATGGRLRAVAVTRRSSAPPNSAATPSPCPSRTPAITCMCSARPGRGRRPCSPT